MNTVPAMNPIGKAQDAHGNPKTWGKPPRFSTSEAAGNRATDPWAIFTPHSSHPPFISWVHILWVDLKNAF